MNIAPIFHAIVNDLRETGYSIQLNALPHSMSASLANYAKQSVEGFSAAGVGRQHAHTIDPLVRSDQIQWIDERIPAGKQWLAWCEQLRMSINQQLYLGLIQFESHFSHYAKGAFYKRHTDAFKGSRNRVISVVAYLNEQWSDEDGGQLVIYQNEHDMSGVCVTPSLGTVVVFLSDEFAHEVLPAERSRYAIAGWFRQND